MPVFLMLLALQVMPGFAADTVIRLKPKDCKIEKDSLDQELGKPEHFARDGFCARLLLDRNAPDGAVTIFGSARLKEGHPSYDVIREFARKWTQKHGNIPILTGGGPGLMEAGDRGAKEGGGKSYGFTVGFGKNGIEKPNSFTTEAYQFRDFALRESFMVNAARAVVVGSGGVGTVWEIFETITKKQTKKIPDLPIVFLGSEDEWTSLKKALKIMAEAGTIHEDDLGIIHRVTSADEAIQYIETYPALVKSLGPKLNKTN